MNHTILIVEDEKGIRETLAIFLEIRDTLLYRLLMERML